MGRKITVDSATLMNKGLEVIEAKYLFGLSHEQIEVVVHKQSVVHSAVEFIDGSVVAQLGSPDMRLPIQYALLDSERLTSPAKKLNLLDYPNLTFEKPDVKTFNCLGLAYDALEAGEAAPAVLNSANDFAVDSFCNDEIKFTDIPLIVANALRQFGNKFLESQSVEDIQKINIAVHNTLSKDFFKERT
jgi:1-deoxy-D-xylulose-5-phosphate reductoisomerase